MRTQHMFDSFCLSHARHTLCKNTQKLKQHTRKFGTPGSRRGTRRLARQAACSAAAARAAPPCCPSTLFVIVCVCDLRVRRGGLKGAALRFRRRRRVTRRQPPAHTLCTHTTRNTHRAAGAPGRRARRAAAAPARRQTWCRGRAACSLVCERERALLRERGTLAPPPPLTRARARKPL